MKKLVLLAGAMMIVAMPALAGGQGEKCSSDMQTCMAHWSKVQNKGWTGLKTDQSDGGAIAVKAVQSGSPAAAAGFQVGDVMVAMNGVSFADKEAIKKAKGDWKVGQSVSYTVKRAGAEKTIAVTLASMPEEVFAAMVGNHMIENHFPTETASASSTEAASATKAVKEDKK